MALTDSRRAELEAKIQRHVVRFVDVKPDWRPFTKHPKPGNDRAVFQYLGPNGHGYMDPWALPAERFGLSLLYMPPGQGAPYHTHDAEEVFVVLEGLLTFAVLPGEGAEYLNVSLPVWEPIARIADDLARAVHTQRHAPAGQRQAVAGR